MATTHTLTGIVLGTVVWALIPKAGTLPVLATTSGGLSPDFGLYAGHRKTPHLPMCFSALAVPAVVVAALNSMIMTPAVALFLAVAAPYSASDVLGGGLELKLWLGTSERTTYDHWNGRWFTPRRLIRYDGAPEDLVLMLVFAALPVLVFDGLAGTLAISVIAVSGAYVLFRKPMVAIAEVAVAAMSNRVVDLMPGRSTHDFRWITPTSARAPPTFSSTYDDLAAVSAVPDTDQRSDDAPQFPTTNRGVEPVRVGAVRGMDRSRPRHELH